MANNKVVIFSMEHNEISTNDVIDWLCYNNISFLRINDNITLDIIKKQKLFNFKFNSKKSFWYRRGSIKINDYSNMGLFQNYLAGENEKIIEFINYNLLSSKHINKFSDNQINKLVVQKIALKNGIKMPKSFISNFEEFNNNYEEQYYYSKPINESSLKFTFNNHNVKINFCNQLITNSENKINSFSESFFQKYVDKKFEIRTFYLKGKFQSMAIFSQQNEKTKYDFRNYDYERPNRCVPYTLPKTLERKLHNMMLELKINCGSMDLIYSNNGKYYFLEVNPIGQFQWLSKSCNYFIERQIMNDLTN